MVDSITSGYIIAIMLAMYKVLMFNVVVLFAVLDIFQLYLSIHS